MAHSHQSRRSYLQSLGSQALVDLSDCCCFRSLSRLGELVDQILFERQLAQPPLPLDPQVLEGAALLRAVGAAAPLQATAGPGGVGRAWGDRAAVGLAPRHPAPWPGCRTLYGAIGPCWRLQGPEAHCRQIGGFARAQGLLMHGHTYLDRDGDGGGMPILAVSLSDWGNIAAAPRLGWWSS